MLTGTFARAIDEKFRLAVPKRLREALGCELGAVLYLAPGTDGSLALYTEAAFSRLAERIGQLSPTGQSVRAYSRLFYARAQQVELDGQGRVRIPPELAQLAQLNREAVLLGVQDHLELWAADRWRVYLDEKQAHYDEIAEAALGNDQ
jgi:MraZ protein